MERTRCVIVSGGSFSRVEGLCPDSDFVIACDRGYTYCERLGLKPDLLISDFDSYSGSVDPSVPVSTFACEKDDTDTMLAVRFALEHGFREVLLCCALGGRLDHLIANLQALVFARKHGLSASIRSEDTEIIALADSSLLLPQRKGWSLSVFAFDGPCRGVCIRGAKYPIENAVITPSFPVGVSNEWARDQAVISVSEGILLVILARLPASETENC